MPASEQKVTDGSASAEAVEPVNLQLDSAQTEQKSARQDAFLLAQYSALREEVLKRIELQHQIILGTLVAIGTIVTVGTQGGAAIVLLIYPFLGMFLTLAWSQNDDRNRQITQHLLAKEEQFLSDLSLGWEHTRTSSRLWFFGSRKVFAARGIFIGSQILTLLLFGLQIRASGQSLLTEELILFGVDLGIIFITLLIIGFPSRRTASKQ
jgi:hypothetical protein